MNYRVTLKCVAEQDAKKYDRDLQMNNYEAATATFKTLVRGALEDIIDAYVIEFYYGEVLAYKMESLKV